MPRKKQTEEELAVPQEIRENIMHQVMVQLKRAVDRLGVDPDDLEDEAWWTPDLGFFEPDEKQIISIRLDGRPITLYLPSMIVDEADFAAQCNGRTRTKEIEHILWNYGIPVWLALRTRRNPDRSGSVAFRTKALLEMNKEFLFNQRTEKTAAPLIRHVRSLVEMKEQECYEEAAKLLENIIAHTEEMKNIFWRRRVRREVLRQSDSIDLIMIALVDADTPGAVGIAETFNRWKREDL